MMEEETVCVVGSGSPDRVHDTGDQSPDNKDSVKTRSEYPVSYNRPPGVVDVSAHLTYCRKSVVLNGHTPKFKFGACHVCIQMDAALFVRSA